MEISDEVTTVSKEINAWMKTLPQADRPRIHSAEVPLLIHYARKLRLRDILVEIGTGWGGSTAIFAKVTDPSVGLYTIDDGSNFRRFGPKDGRHYGEFIEERFRMYGVVDGVDWILDDSRTINWGSLPIHLLFIDGAHSYEGVKGDIENMVPHIVPNGVAVFHDYHMKGVKAAVDEFLGDSNLEIENRAHATVAVRV